MTYIPPLPPVPEIKTVIEKKWNAIYYKDIPIEQKNKEFQEYIEELVKKELITEIESKKYLTDYWKFI